MDKFDRIQKLHRILKQGGRHSLLSLAEHLDCSTETVKRLVTKLRNEMSAPVFYDRSQHGYMYIPRDAEAFELPGVWLTAEEVQAFAVIISVIKTLENQVLSRDFELVEKKIHSVLSARGIESTSFISKIAFLPIKKSKCSTYIYNTVCQAVLQEKQLDLEYQDYTGKKTERTISPLKIVLYKDNWYLDAYCHKREALRSFMLSRINNCQTLKRQIKKVGAEKQKRHFEESYGIFAGKAKHQAKIRFYPQVAREVANQSWHPDQHAEWEDNELILTFPYSDDRELVREILSYGNNAEVIAPAKLKNKIRNILRGMWEIYS